MLGIIFNPSTGTHYSAKALFSVFPFWFPGGSDGKASACNVGDPGSIPESGRSPGEGNGNPLQYPCLENSMDGGAWRATVHGVAKSQTRLSNFTFTFSNLSQIYHLILTGCTPILDYSQFL